MRRCHVRSFAKLNLDLRVLQKRPDGFHELRTVFQTISLSDTLVIEYVPSRQTSITLGGNIEIADNLVRRAAQAVCDATGKAGAIRFQLTKRIPMGAGLGGGSSNAAAVLLALPPLLGARIGLDTLRSLGAELGSDVPFFLFGGTALGIGRGTELYPLPDLPKRSGLLVAPAVHSSTAEAYRSLGRGLTSNASETDTGSFQSVVWGLGEDCQAGGWPLSGANDFEPAVFSRFPRLQSIRDKLRKAGAKPALMTGSGSALFGLFDGEETARRTDKNFALRAQEGDRQFVFSLVSRRQYQRLWRGWLKEHVAATSWPPQTRYLKR